MLPEHLRKISEKYNVEVEEVDGKIIVRGGKEVFDALEAICGCYLWTDDGWVENEKTCWLLSTETQHGCPVCKVYVCCYDDDRCEAEIP